MKTRKMLFNIFTVLLIFIGATAIFSSLWYTKTYGNTGFDSILFTVLSNIEGTEKGIVTSYLLKAFLPSVLFTVMYICVLHIAHSKKITHRFINPIYIYAMSFVLSAAFLCISSTLVGFHDYIINRLTVSTLYEEYYADPAETEIIFPDEKRNLIYIFMESMETTYLSEDLGGGAYMNLIPNLTQLARDNINFSHTDDVGGFLEAPGTSWTIAAMFAHTSGIPLQVSVFEENSCDFNVHFKNLTNLSDILHQNGYTQALMVGSDANFGGRKTYYSVHNTDHVFDLFTSYDDGIVPQGYYEWWGIEDLHLYNYAQQKITELANGEDPFAFTLLTVDTHFADGYKCDLCQPEHWEKYENTISCADRQVYNFIQWLSQQDFYDNTTIVICGDHQSMDAAFFEKAILPNSDRRIYNCFINSAVEPISSKNRTFSTLDMFPTTLAAMGCTIDNNRLGLGTNLFSDCPTLSESLGVKNFFKAIQKNSEYYNKLY